LIILKWVFPIKVVIRAKEKAKWEAGRGRGDLGFSSIRYWNRYLKVWLTS